MEEQKKKGVLKKDKRPKLLFGKTYEVECEECEGGNLGWFTAIYMSSHAREMGWAWEIIDPKFKYEESYIINWRTKTA